MPLDGLRGLAVLAVVTYHFEPGVLPGGFLGVDVFFVLSGFLIGSLLLVEVESSGSVDLRHFYLRRVRRLLPALLAMLSAVAVYAAIWAGPGELGRIRTHSLWTLGWLANWRYIADGTTYTEVVVGASPLRHTWSLAIEEQFYVLFPLVVLLAAVIVARRRGIDQMRWTIGILAAAGFLVSTLAMAWMTRDGDELARAYFGTDTRLHALLAGVVVAAAFVGLPPTDGRAAHLARIGAVPATIVLVVLLLQAGETELWMYRGGFAAVAIATAAVIVAVGSAQWLGRVLSWTPLVGLGLISYGVYLWHWPILVVVDSGRTGLTGLPLTALRLSLTMMAALGSWWLIEQPVRRGALGRVVGRWSTAVAGVSVAGVAGLVLWATSLPGLAPVPSQASEERTLLLGSIGSGGFADSTDSAGDPEQTESPVEPHSVVLVGDSVAHTLAGALVFEFPRFDEWTPESTLFDPDEVRLSAVTRPGCSFMPGTSVYPDENGVNEYDLSSFCGDWASDLAASVVTNDADHIVVLLSNDVTDRRLDGDLVRAGTPTWYMLLDETLDHIRTAASLRDATVLLLSPAPKTGPYLHPDDAGGWREQLLTAGLQSYAERFDDVHVLDLAGAVCPAGDCRSGATGFDPDWRYDGWHFDRRGAEWFAEWLTGQLR